MPIFLKKRLRAQLREDERKKGLTGATYLFLSMSITIFIFEKNIAVPALLILTLADSFAAIIGKLKGKHKFLCKSIEGSITFFLFVLGILCIFVPEIGITIIVIALLITIVEALPIPINDNILIPIFAGIFLMYL